MSKLLAKILHPVTMTVLGLIVLELVIWFGGSALHEAGWLTWFGPTGLLVLCVLVVVVAAGVWQWRRYSANKRAAAIERQLRDSAKQQVETMRPDLRGDVEELQKQLDKAVGSLKDSRLGRGALYALPWYMIVGPPGSGKTTMLRESGLNFPDPDFGGRGLRGVGGTRNCDWWFTDQAILLDTAGRYATEDEDRDEWVAFLEMVAKARKQKPINGVIVAISIEEIAGAADSELAEHAERIRQRIDELNKQLDLVFPIYIVFTKCDLLDGFVESFEGMTRADRAQVWGHTIPVDVPADEVHSTFVREFAALQDRICAHRLSLLASERAVGKQQRVYSFPLQIAAACENLSEFVRQLSAPNPYRDGSQIRGFYLTSGTQEGAPIDRVLGAMRGRLGLSTDTAIGIPRPADLGDEAKSYFIGDLFNEVIFADRDLAKSSAGSELRRLWLRRAAAAAMVLFALFLVVRMFGTYFENTARIAAATEAIEIAHRLPDPPTTGVPEPAVVEDLETLRRAFVDVHDNRGWPALLDRSNELYEPVREEYVRALKRYFLIPCAQYLQDRLVAWNENPARSAAEVPAVRSELRAYGALRGLRDAGPTSLRELLRDVWRWADHGMREKVADRMPHLDHFETFLDRICHQPKSVWCVQGDPDVYDEVDAIISKDADSSAWRIALDIAEEAPSEPGETEVEVVTEVFDVERSALMRRIDEALVELGLPVNDETRANQLDQIREAQADRWRLKIGTMRLEQYRNVSQAEQSLDRWVKDGVLQRVYREAVTKLREFNPDLVAPPASSAKIDGLDQAVEELGKLVTELQIFNQKKRDSRVLAVGDRDAVVVHAAVAPLRQAIARTRSAIDPKLDNIPCADLRLPFRDALAGAISNVEAALRFEACDELQAYWARVVGADLETFAKQYPFDEKVSSEVQMSAFADVFRPQTGQWANAARLIAQMESDFELPLSDDFKTARRRIETLQEAMFAADESGASTASPTVRFRVLLENVDEALRTTFVYAISSNKRVSSDMRASLQKTEIREWVGNDHGARVETEDRSGAVLALNEDADSPWALFRLIGAAEQQPDPTLPAATLLTWRLQKPGVQLRVALSVSPVGSSLPFEPGFFSTIEFPQRLFRVD